MVVLLCLWACLFAVICDVLPLLGVVGGLLPFIVVGAYWLDGVQVLLLTLIIGDAGLLRIGWNVVWVWCLGFAAWLVVCCAWVVWLSCFG